MQVGEVQTISLVQHMADKAALWASHDQEARAEAVSLRRARRLAVRRLRVRLRLGRDADVTKSRLHGFHEVVDSEAMFVRLLRRFRKEKIVP